MYSLNNKYDSISPCDKSICTFFNEVDDIVRDAGLKTRIRAGSEDNILEIVDGDTMIGMVDGLSAGISHPGNEEMMFSSR